MIFVIVCLTVAYTNRRIQHQSVEHRGHINVKVVYDKLILESE